MRAVEAKVMSESISMVFYPNTLFDIHARRMHEYKRQLFNILHVIRLYHCIQQNNEITDIRRIFFFAGKAAPVYFQANKLKGALCMEDNNEYVPF
jgi:starch phosphorylase